jgi:hypothetical protein
MVQRASSKAKRRRKLFERGVVAFQRVTNTREDLYDCPMCEQPFGRDALANRQLALEHVPPQALLGRDILLTCLDCQKLGSCLDAAAKEHARLWNLNEALSNRDGQYRGRAILELGGHKVAADVDARKGSAKLTHWTKSNNPETSRSPWITMLHSQGRHPQVHHLTFQCPAGQQAILRVQVQQPHSDGSMPQGAGATRNLCRDGPSTAAVFANATR